MLSRNKIISFLSFVLTVSFLFSLLGGSVSAGVEMPFTRSYVSETVTDIDVNVTEVTVEEGKTFQVYAQQIPYSAPLTQNRGKLKFTSGDTGIFRVGGSTGLVTGVNAGSAVLTITADNVVKTLNVTVIPAIEPTQGVTETGFSLGFTELTISAGKKYTLSPVFIPENTYDKSLTFVSDKPGVAYVDAGMQIVANDIGTAHITATSNMGYTQTITVNTVSYGPIISTENAVPGTPAYLGSSVLSEYKPPENITIGNNSYTLSFFDDFSGETLNSEKWSFAPEWNRHQTGYFDNRCSSVNGKGQYVSTATVLDKPGIGKSFTSGAITTSGKFEQAYGYFEACLAAPCLGEGFWSTVWLQNDSYGVTATNGGDTSSCLRIVEAMGGSKRALFHSVHWMDENIEEKLVLKYYNDSNFFIGYHTVGMEWTPDDYIFYVDGIEAWRASDQSDNGITDKCGICKEQLALYICTEFGTWAGNASEENLPEELLVDYVRIYSYDEPVLPGDVSGDGKVNIVDAMSLYGYVAGTINSLNNPKAADLTKDGKTNIGDAMKLFSFVAGIIKEL